MSYCFIVACVTGREKLLNEFISTARTSKYKDCDYYLYYQDIPGKESKGEFDKSFFKDIHVSNTRDGACLPKMYWLNKLDNYDFYILMDDDMEFHGKEDFETPMRFVESVTDCGLCRTACYRTMKHYDSAVLNRKFIVENIQWIGGGMIVKKQMRDLLIREIELKPYTYDGFCFVTYLNGYTNYKYCGSATLHKAGRKDGVEYVYKHHDEFSPHFEQYIKKPHDERGRLVLPTRESELTEEAKRLHEESKLRLDAL